LKIGLGDPPGFSHAKETEASVSFDSTYEKERAMSEHNDTGKRDYARTATQIAPSDGRGKSRKARQRRHCVAPRLEALEERRLLSYTVANLGSLGGTDGIPFDINDRGAVVGSSYTANNAAPHAFLYNHGKMTDLGAPGGTQSLAIGINDNGAVVGLSKPTPGSQQIDLFLYSHGRRTGLGSLDPSTSPFSGIKINDRGDVIGFPLSNGDASLVRRGRKIDLGSLAGLGSAARALNNGGEVAGFAAIARVPGTGGTSKSILLFQAFLYSHGRMTNLGTLGGAESIANDINDRGLVVGSALTASQVSHAFLYRDGRMIDLGTLGGTISEAAAINDRGVVVGRSLTSGSVSHAFIYRDGRMIDLNSLVPANSGFVITNAEAINHRGQIAAEAVSTNAQDHSGYVVLLKPTKNGR
jgi:probable HAF family extracellular repeat protein